MSTESRVVLAVAAAVVLLAAVAGGILFLRDEDPPSAYDAEIEDDFMATCTADAEALGFTRPTDHCACVFDRIRAEIAFERFVEIDEALQEDPTAVPRSIERIRAACYLTVEAGPAGTTVPTT